MCVSDVCSQHALQLAVVLVLVLCQGLSVALSVCRHLPICTSARLSSTRSQDMPY